MSTIKLPDFRKHAGLNELRRKMGADLVAYDPVMSSSGISRKDLERLKTTGIIVGTSEIEYLENGIFVYQEVPVLLYIYCPTQWNNHDLRLPKFHLCNCRTWDDMKAKGRQDLEAILTDEQKNKLKAINRGDELGQEKKP